MTARVRLPDDLEQLSRTEMETAIYEANLGDFDAGIAQRYLIRQIPLADIAAEYGYDRSAIGKRVKRILEKVSAMAERISKAGA